MNDTHQPAAGPAGGRLIRAILFARSRWKQVVCGAVIVVLIGVGIGWRACGSPPDFEAIGDSEARKAAFIAYLSPMAERANGEVGTLRARLLAIDAEMKAGKAAGLLQRYFVRKAARRHGIDADGEVNAELVARVLRRVDTVPVSLVIAQAAIESGWGTSRFAREGNNLFGLRTQSGRGLVPEKRAPGERFTVASYSTACDGVRAYIQNLNTHPRYRDLRTIRATLRDSGLPASGERLAYGLLFYSERGADYVEQVRSLIAYNDLGRFDS